MSRTPRLAAALLVAASLLAAGNARAQTAVREPVQPHPGYLVLAGAGMALPTYWLTLTLHEGSHALSALSFGAEVTRFSVLPGRIDGRFYFGYVQFRGRLTLAERTFVLLAPKIPDVLALGTYAALVGTGTLPRNAYGRMALAVLATGFWVDFSKDLVAFWSPPDVTRALRQNGLRTFVQRLPWYALHAALSGAGAYLLVRGYQGVFSPGSPAAPPIGFTLLSGSL